MADIRRTAALVVDDRDFVALAAEPEHRADEVRAGPAEEPRRADDPGVLPRHGLAVQLRPPVHGERIRRVGLDVRRPLRPVEDVVGREAHEGLAELGDVLRPADVDRRCRLRVGFGAVDVRVGGGVQDELDRTEAAWRREGHVPVGVRKAACSGERLEQRRAELPARAGYDDVSRSERIGDVVLQRWRMRSSSHGMPCSSGFAASYSSVTR